MNEGLKVNPVVDEKEKFKNEIESIKDATVLNSKFKDFTDGFKKLVIKLREADEREPYSSWSKKINEYLDEFPISLYLKTFSETEVGKNFSSDAKVHNYLYSEESIASSRNSDISEPHKFYINEDKGLINLMAILYEDIEENNDLKNFAINFNRHKKISSDSYTFMNTINEDMVKDFKAL